MDTPTLKPYDKGDTFKVLEIAGKKGMKMPEHLSTSEVVVTVQEGSADLFIDGKQIKLDISHPVIIPKDVYHSLEITADFKAMGIFPLDGDIKFK